MTSRLAALIGASLALLAGALPAAAATTYVQDGAGMFSSDTVSSLNTRIGNFNAQTGKEVVVVTVPSLGGSTIQQAAQQAFSGQSINGILVYISKDDRRDYFLPGANEVHSGLFSSSVLDPIRQSMEAQFKTGDFDGGIQNAVGSILGVYHSHLSSLPQRGGATSTGYSRTYAPVPQQSGGGGLSMFWIIVLIVVGFLVLRSIMRAMSGRRSYGGPGAGGPGYGGPGFGGGGYYGGGGGGFWSGLLGGLGGAWLGNELFSGNRGLGGGTIDPSGGGNLAQTGDPGGGGWANDAGQADAGGSSGGDWGGGGFGDSSGGFGGGGGDFGGGGGGDSGGGW